MKLIDILSAMWFFLFPLFCLISFESNSMNARCKAYEYVCFVVCCASDKRKMAESKQLCVVFFFLLLRLFYTTFDSMMVVVAPSLYFVIARMYVSFHMALCAQCLYVCMNCQTSCSSERLFTQRWVRSMLIVVVDRIGTHGSTGGRQNHISRTLR